jgi:anti-anti-sigma factor
MQHSNEIKLEKRGAVTIMEIEGDITAFSEPFLNDAYQKAHAQDARKILLKIDEGSYINSGGIAVLIQILAQTKKNNQVIGVTGISDHFKKIFHMVGITKFAQIHNSLNESLEALTGGVDNLKHVD